MGRAVFYHIRVILVLCCCCFVNMVLAQVRVSGIVMDADSHKPLAGASIRTPEGKLLASSDSLGAFSFFLSGSPGQVIVSAMGYTQEYVSVKDKSKIEILLRHEGLTIEEVKVNTKQKYKNRNPATEIIDLIIRHKKYNKLEKKDSLYFEQYEKIKMGLVDPQRVFDKAPSNMSYFFNNVDTTFMSEKDVLNIFMKETIADVYVKQHPARQKKIVKAEKKTEFDPRYINNANIHAFMDYMFQPIDIYDESIFLINKQFLSPIADNAKLFYKYYIVDTLRTTNDLRIRLRFEPRNSKDLLFRGDLIVSMDGRYAVSDARLFIDEKTNVSWISDLNLRLSYFKNEEGIMLQDTTEVSLTFGRGTKEVMFGHRVSVNSGYDLHYPVSEEMVAGAPIETKLNPLFSLEDHRPIMLNSSEAATYVNVERLNNEPSFRRLMSVGYLLSQGYYSLGKVELGPLEYLYHQNPIEGHRIRVGGRTTAAFSDRVYMEGYLAYGVEDKDMKYNFRTAISLNRKPVTTFPAHYLEFYVQHDIFEPGKSLGFLKGDGFFRTFRSNKPTKYLATDAFKLSHLIEFGNHVSLATALTMHHRSPIGDMRFDLAGAPSKSLEHINTADLQLLLRWAPNERFYYRNLQRSTIVQREPVFTIQYNRGFKEFMGGDYDYDALRVAAAKRFFLNQLGFADMTIHAGKIWGTLPYPLLEIPGLTEMKDRTSVSYERTESMEFVADRFLKLSYDHRLQGFILNRIPLVRQLKWRETFGARMFWGDLSDKNNPYINGNVIRFEQNEEGTPVTRIMTSQPYWEGYVGLENIFKILSVRYYVRLTYDDVNDSFKDRLRFNLRFSF